MNLHREKSEDNNKINTKQMSYERRNRFYGEVTVGDLERTYDSAGCDPDSKRNSGNDGESELRLLAPADSGDSVDDGRMRKLGKTVSGRRKALENAMAWLFDPQINQDVWMIKEK